MSAVETTSTMKQQRLLGWDIWVISMNHYPSIYLQTLRFLVVPLVQSNIATVDHDMNLFCDAAQLASAYSCTEIIDLISREYSTTMYISSTINIQSFLDRCYDSNRGVTRNQLAASAVASQIRQKSPGRGIKWSTKACFDARWSSNSEQQMWMCTYVQSNIHVYMSN